MHLTLVQYLLLSSLRIFFPLPSAFSLPPSSSSRLACLPRNLSHQTFLRVSQLCLIKHHGATTLRETRHTRFCLRSQTWHNVLLRPQACEVREAIALYTRHSGPTLRYYSGIFRYCCALQESSNSVSKICTMRFKFWTECSNVIDNLSRLILHNFHYIMKNILEIKGSRVCKAVPACMTLVTPDSVGR